MGQFSREEIEETFQRHQQLVVEIGNERDNVEAALGGLDLIWASTSGGDDNVFVIRARSSDQLAQLVDRKNPSVGTIVTMSASLVVRPVMS